MLHNNYNTLIDINIWDDESVIYLIYNNVLGIVYSQTEIYANTHIYQIVFFFECEQMCIFIYVKYSLILQECIFKQDDNCIGIFA